MIGDDDTMATTVPGAADGGPGGPVAVPGGDRDGVVDDPGGGPATPATPQTTPHAQGTPHDEGDEPPAELDPLAVVEAERDEYLDSLRRLQAEFDNYRKRVAKQQAEQAERAALSLVDKLLPVLDALDLAGTHVSDPGSGDARALLAASSLLNGALAKEGLERVDPLGQPFDPNAHEAVGHMPDDEMAAPEGSGEEAAGTDSSAGPGSPVDTDSPAGAGSPAGPDGPADPDGKDGKDSKDSKDSSDSPGSPPEPASGPVVGQVMRAGYRWKGTVVRPAMVMVRG